MNIPNIKFKLCLKFIVFSVVVQTAMCQQSQYKQEVNYLKTRLNFIADRVEKLEHNKLADQETIRILSAQSKKLENQLSKDQEIINMEQIRIEALEELFNKTKQSLNNHGQEPQQTTTIPQSTTMPQNTTISGNWIPKKNREDTQLWSVH